MEKPKITSSADAMRWNADVERRRREHHESRCAEEIRKADEAFDSEIIRLGGFGW